MSTPPTVPTRAPVPDEAAARRVLLVQAFDCGAADNPLWTREDRAWATRMARETTPADASEARFLDERAHHALQRLRPRDAGVVRALDRRLWRRGWLTVALAVGLLAGIAADTIGGSQRINLLAPPVWAVIAWNLVVYLALLWTALRPSRPSGLRAWLTKRLAGSAGGSAVLVDFQRRWLVVTAPLALARAELLLHAAAATLALGLVVGLYVRGLVLDYRAGWQSTFLDAAQVQATLALLLAPASAVTGISVPGTAELQALQVPGAGADTLPPASAAPWLHLYATMLGLFVIAPRALLMLVAAGRARRLARRLPLRLDEPYFQRLLRLWRQVAARVQLLPYGAAPSLQALVGAQSLLVAALGEGTQVVPEATAAHGEEAQVAPAPPGTTLRVLLVDLAATPEDEAHGRWVQALRASAPVLPLLLLADEAAWRARFATLPQRLAERRAAWQRWAAAQGLGFISADLRQPDLPAAEAALQAALAA